MQFRGPFRIPTTTAKSANPAGFHSLHITADIFSPHPFQNVHDTTISGNAHFNVAGRDIRVYGFSPLLVQVRQSLYYTHQSYQNYL